MWRDRKKSEDLDDVNEKDPMFDSQRKKAEEAARSSLKKEASSGSNCICMERK